MFFSDEYYYEEDSFSGFYSDVPSGELDVNRFFSGYPDYFYQPSCSVAQKKQKTIIINDWALRNYGEKLSLYEHIDKLIQQGFEVHQVDSHQLIKIESLLHLNPPRKGLVNQREFNEVILRNNLERDKILVIDYCKINQLIEFEPFPEGNVYQKHLENSHLSTEEKEVIIKSKNVYLIEDALKPPPYVHEGKMATSLLKVYDAKVLESLFAIPGYINHLIHLDLRVFDPMDFDNVTLKLQKRINDYESMTLSSRWFKILISDNASCLETLPNLKSLILTLGDNRFSVDLADHFIKISKASALSTLSIALDDRTVSATKTNIPLPTSLKELNLSGQMKSYLLFNKIIPFFNSDSVQNLDIRYSKQVILADSLLRLKHLKVLTFQHCHFDDQLEELHLDHLVELSIENCIISAKELSRILNSAPHLKKLKLKNIKIQEELDLVECLELKELVVINNSHSTGWLPENINHLINASPNIETLELVYIKLPQKGLKTPEQLRHLTLLGLRQISLDTLAPILSPSIEYLRIDNSRLVDGIETIRLPLLKEFKGEKLLINQQFLHLIVNSPGVNRFDLGTMSTFSLDKENILRLAKQLKISAFTLTKEWYDFLGKNGIEQLLSDLPHLSILNIETLEGRMLPKIPFEKLGFLQIDANRYESSQELGLFLKSVMTHSYEIIATEIRFKHSMFGFSRHGGKEELKLVGVSRFGLNCEEPLQFNALHALKIANSHFSMSHFLNLLNQIKWTKHFENRLSFEELNIDNAMIEFKNNELSIKRHITVGQLNELIKIIPKIKGICLHGVLVDGDFSPFLLPHLTHLTLFNVKLNHSVFNLLNAQLQKNKGKLKLLGPVEIISDKVTQYETLYLELVDHQFIKWPQCKVTEELRLRNASFDNTLSLALDRLKRLILSDCYCDDVKFFSRLSNLEEIVVESKTKKGIEGLNLIFSACQTLQKLHVKNAIFLDDLNFHGAMKLREVTFENVWLDFNTFKHWVKTAPKHCVIVLDDCTILGQQSEINSFIARHKIIAKQLSFEITHMNMNNKQEKLATPLLNDPSFRPVDKPLEEITSLADDDSDSVWSQSMLINRLRAYMDFKAPNLGKMFAENIQKGICNAVAKWYADTVLTQNEAAWTVKLYHIKQWSKQSLPKVDSDTANVLNEFLSYVSHYHFNFHDIRPTSRILVNDLDIFFENPPFYPVLLCSAWHATALVYKNNQWYFYDPNFIRGLGKVFRSKDSLISEIRRAVGSGLEVISFHEKLSKTWSYDEAKINQYIQDGGFAYLMREKDNNLLLSLNVEKLSNEALKGLFFYNLNTNSMLIQGLNYLIQSNQTAECLIIFQCLEKYHASFGKDAFRKKINEQLRAALRHGTSIPFNYLKSERDRFTFIPILVKELITILEAGPIETIKPKNNLALSSLNDDDLLKEMPNSLIDVHHTLAVNDTKEFEPQFNVIEDAPADVIEEHLVPVSNPEIIQNRDSQDSVFSEDNELTSQNNSRFQTWNPPFDKAINTINAFDFEVLRHQGANVLVHMDDEQISNYIHHLQHRSWVKAHGSLFVINTPGDLKCATNRLRLTKEGKGLIEKGSPLAQFLVEQMDKEPLIVVNWRNFKPQEMIQANTILDTVRLADGTPLPAKAIVLGLQNPDAPDAYLGSDFASRHKVILDCPQANTIPEVILPKEANAEAVKITIDFFNESRWQSFLYGKWSLNKNEFYFKPSAFFEALNQEPKPGSLKLILKNAPWHLAEFRFAINSLISEQCVTYQGYPLEIPGSFTIEKESGFILEPLVNGLNITQGFVQQYDFVLNAETFERFFIHYKLENNQLTTLPGFLETYQGRVIHLYVTRDIVLSSFVRLLTEAKANDCLLHLHLAPLVKLPKEMMSIVRITPCNEEMALNESIQLIQSDDIAYTEQELSKNDAFDMVIDVSELKKGELFYALTGSHEDANLAFNETKSCIWQALLVGKTVLLKGKFSPELINSLAPLFKENAGVFHNGQWEVATGKLVLLTDYHAEFSFISHRELRKVNLDDKLKALSEPTRLTAHYKKDQLKLSFSYLKALSQLDHLPKTPEDLSAPLYHLQPIPTLEDDFNLDEERSLQFKEDRKTLLFEAFKKGPTVFLSGKTGVGKSSFMHALVDEGFQVHFGEIEKWVNASGANKPNLLFIDEANLANTDWSMFEGLYSKPRGIFVKGSYYLLGENDVVVFAGNPASYGGERTMPCLFKDHPNVVIFGSMSNAYLYHQVIKPLLPEDIGEEKAKILGVLLLKVFQNIALIDENAISARELQMMVYLLRAKQMPADLFERAKLSACQIASGLLKEEARPSFHRWFHQEFGSISLVSEDIPKVIGHPHAKEKDSFLLTGSHQGVYLKINELLQVRQMKQKSEGKLTYGGLAGVVLEGEPGVGKSHLVKQVLLNQGVIEKKINVLEFKAFDFDLEEKALKEQGAKKHFYHLPASLSISTKIALLNRAFHEGAVVIIDEINTSILLERLINAILMGEDIHGRRAVNPGFTLIGTQNPVSMAGRKKASLAVQRRLINIEFPEYTPKEMVDVLVHKGCLKQDSCKLVYEFLTAKQYAHANNLQPEPCFRDLLRASEALIEGYEPHHAHLLLDKVALAQETIKREHLPKIDSIFPQDAGLTKAEAPVKSNLINAQVFFTPQFVELPQINTIQNQHADGDHLIPQEASITEVEDQDESHIVGLF